MTNSDDVLIKVKNVSKKFCRSLKRSMLDGIEDISRDLFADFRVEYGELIWGDYELCFPVIDLYRNTIEHYPPTTTAAA
ncbi:hypothetical protein [Methylotuvimicrobium sp. KM1]|uniref:hypothetical protein n=1 Tax=Methylotuvimicrobium sp. KM1 TaxID=3377707 RepID=UPI00384BD217